MSGGFGFRIAGVLVRAHSPAIAIGAALGAIALAATRGRAQIGAASRWWWRVIDRGAAPMACAVAIAAIATGWVWGTHVAGGSDSYCYLNEAELLAGGHARQLQPDAANICRGPTADGPSCPRVMRPRQVRTARSCRSALRDIH